MKNYILSGLAALAFFCSSCFSNTVNTLDAGQLDYAQIVTHLYKDFFEKKNFVAMNKYIAKNVSLNKDFSGTLDYSAIKEHLMEQGAECVQLNMLPFDSILVSDNKVTVLYTQKCTDKLNKIHKKRMMVINEIDNSGKVSRIWAVTHEQQD